MAPGKRVKDWVPLDDRHPRWQKMACGPRCGLAKATDAGKALWECEGCKWLYHPSCAPVFNSCDPGDVPTSTSKWYCDSCCKQDELGYARGHEKGLKEGLAKAVGRQRKTARKSASRPRDPNAPIRKNFICKQRAVDDKHRGLAAKLCLEKFESGDKLKRHEKAAHGLHGGKDLKCNVLGCDFITAWKDSLTTHMKKCAPKRGQALQIMPPVTTATTMPPHPIE